MKVIYKIKQLLSNLIILVRSFIVRGPDQVRHHVTYVSQFANPGWAEMVIKDNQPLARDLMWPESGANTIEEYEQWALATCGMACASMLIDFYTGKKYKTIALARDAMKAGVYTFENKKFSDMKYKPFVKWIKKFGISATVYSNLNFRSIQFLLSSSSLIIASVNPNIRGFNTAPATQVGGHLVLIVGYNKKEQTVTIHNPAGFENDLTQKNHTVHLKEFDIYFSGKGIAVQLS